MNFKQNKVDRALYSYNDIMAVALYGDNLQAFNEAGIDVPVILGGAALTPRFVQKDCREVYSGKVIYGRDAFADLRFMDALMDAKSKDNWTNQDGFLEDAPQGVGLDESPKQSDDADAPQPAAVKSPAPELAPVFVCLLLHVDFMCLRFASQPTILIFPSKSKHCLI